MYYNAKVTARLFVYMSDILINYIKSPTHVQGRHVHPKFQICVAQDFGRNLSSLI